MQTLFNGQLFDHATAPATAIEAIKLTKHRTFSESYEILPLKFMFSAKTITTIYF